MIVVVMGVSGAGKSTLGAQLAARLGCAFLDGDDFHPPENVAKMAAGTPLEDADRWPWLARLNALLREAQVAGRGTVLACSALKARYRERLAEGVDDCRWVHLDASPQVLRERLAARRHRYMPASLLESQLAALEAPAGALRIDVGAPEDACLAKMLAALAPPRTLQ